MPLLGLLLAIDQKVYFNLSANLIVYSCRGIRGDIPGRILWNPRFRSDQIR